jgi:adenine-specific DNA-methyltransferase
LSSSANPTSTSFPTEKNGQLRVKVKGVDVFHPNTGEVRSDGPDDIACWFIDTDYNEESFFVRHAYFLGAKRPVQRKLKTTLKAEIDEEAWADAATATPPAPSTSRKVRPNCRQGHQPLWATR